MSAALKYVLTDAYKKEKVKKLIKIKGVFNATNLTDLPAKMQKDLGSVNRKETVHNKILKLFKLKEPLTVVDVTIGLYRAEKIVKSRYLIAITLWKLCEKGCLETLPLRNKKPKQEAKKVPTIRKPLTRKRKPK